MPRRVRLYAEAIEQAYFFILPAIENTIPGVDVELVYAPSRLKSRHENQTLQALYQATTPDGLISMIDGDVEIPLAVIEFSESVMTEDHEYQRTPGVFLCAALDLVYIKVAGHKHTTHGMGGNTRFNPLSVASAFIQEADYFGFLMCKWKTIPGDPTKLWRDDVYPSIPHRNACPLYLDSIRAVINTAFYDHILPGNDFAKSVWECLKYTELGQEYTLEIEQSPNLLSLNNSWENATQNLGYRRWHAEDGTMTVWIYRWGHGMDPDRGCLQFVGSFSHEHHVVARYTGLRSSRERRIDSEDVYDRESLRARFLEVCKLDKGLDRKMLEQIRYAPIIGGAIDLTDWLCQDGVYEGLNKPATTLVTFADELLIHDVPDHSCSLNVVWDREIILRGPVSADLSHIKRVVDRFDGNLPLPIAHSGPTEDPVTFCFVHDVAPLMGWVVHSASYPGAQGGVVILPDGYGRQRKRIYCDGVASFGNHGILFEAKDSERKSISDMDPEKLHDLVNNELEGVRDAFVGVGVGIESKPLTIVGFYSPQHSYNLDSFSLVDAVLSIDPHDKSWVLYSVTEYRELASGFCSAPEMLAVW